MRWAVDSRDGYTACEELSHVEAAAMLSGDQARILQEVLDASAPERQELPAGLHADLLAALAASQEVLTITLTGSDIRHPRLPGGPALDRRRLQQSRLTPVRGEDSLVGSGPWLGLPAHSGRP